MRSLRGIGGAPPGPFGRRWLQAFAAVSNREGSVDLALVTWDFWICPPLSGSGNADTPWERMHRAKAASPLWGVVTVVVPVEEATLATRGEPPPPQPAASSENATAATLEARKSGRRQRNFMGLTVERRPLHRIARERCLSTAA
jgi:hypothetical protein